MAAKTLTKTSIFGVFYLFAVIVLRREDEAKAERMILKVSRRVEVRRGHSVMFLYAGRPANAKVCMTCDRLKCPLGITCCPVDRAIEETLLGVNALQYVHVRTRIVLTAP